ncbi:MAG TPA: PKD domain-containing protein [Chitinophagales bacterium]|nr:PKD domain-containing protein [Chitinophagales bacterium]
MKKLLIIFVLLTFAGTSHAQVCTAHFSYTQNPGTVQFHNESNPTDSLATYLWTFGDGSSATGYNVTHSYNQSGSFAVCLTMTTFLGCSDTYCDSIQVDSTANSGCLASFTYSMDGTDVAFNNTSYWSQGPATFAWDFGDNTTSSETYPNHTYDTLGSYNVCLTISTPNGCTDTYCSMLYVTDSLCYISYNYDAAGGVVEFTAVGGSPNSGTYTWWFSDGGTATGANPSHIFAASGLYAVCVQYVSIFCTEEHCDSIYVDTNDSCFVSFSHQQAGDNVYFTPDVSSLLISYAWDFGDGTGSTSMMPVHSYAVEGNYTVCLTVSTGICTSTFCGNVYFLPDSINNGNTCNAYFEVSDIDTVTNTISLTDLSTGGFSYLWTFGDGTSSTEQYPSHTYNEDGFYQVCLAIQCDSFTASQFCWWIGMMDSLVGGDGEIRSGFNLNVKPADISGIHTPGKENTLSIFPNPASASIAIQLPAALQNNGTLLFRNVIGAVQLEKTFSMEQGSALQLDISSLPAGIYIVQLKSGDVLMTGRLMRQ